jgi:hypothetical protein
VRVALPTGSLDEVFRRRLFDIKICPLSGESWSNRTELERWGALWVSRLGSLTFAMYYCSLTPKIDWLEASRRSGEFQDVVQGLFSIVCGCGSM